MPIWDGSTPALKNLVTIFSTLAASVLEAKISRSPAAQSSQFQPVEETGPARRYLFLTEVLVEEHGGVGYRPREVNVLPQALGGCDSILQCPLVEHVGREFREARVHAILHLKTYRPVTEDNKAFEERLCQSSAGRFLVHNDRSELLNVTLALIAR